MANSEGQRFTAQCQCGALTCVCSAEPDFVVACNCRACKRRTGATYGVGAYFPKNKIEIGGDSLSWERRADSGRLIRTHFCPQCGTTVFWYLEARPEHVGVAAGCLTPVPRRPDRVLWASEKMDWVEFPADVQMLPKGSPE